MDERLLYGAIILLVIVCIVLFVQLYRAPGAKSAYFQGPLSPLDPLPPLSPLDPLPPLAPL